MVVHRMGDYQMEESFTEALYHSLEELLQHTTEILDKYDDAEQGY